MGVERLDYTKGILDRFAALDEFFHRKYKENENGEMVQVATAEEIEANWHALKAKEKGRESVTDGIPPALPALVLAGLMLGALGMLLALPVADTLKQAEAADRAKSEFLGEAQTLLFPIDWPEPFGLVLIEAIGGGLTWGSALIRV